MISATRVGREDPENDYRTLTIKKYGTDSGYYFWWESKSARGLHQDMIAFTPEEFSELIDDLILLERQEGDFDD